MREHLAKYLERLCLAGFRNPGATLAFLLVTFLASSVYGATHLRLELAWTYLFPANDPVVTEFQQARAKFPFPGDVAVVVDRGTARQREAFLDLVAGEMAKEPERYHYVFHRLELEKLGTRALYFLEVPLLRRLNATLEQSAGSLLMSESAVKVQLKLLGDLKSALLSRGRFTPGPLWSVFTQDQAEQFVQTVSLLLAGERYLYPTLARGRVHVLLFKGGGRGTELEIRGEEVEAVRELLDRLKPSAYGLRVRLTGVPVLLHDERQTCTRDSIRSGIISAILITLVFVVGFGGLRKPLYCLVGLLCGLGWTAAYAALTVGHLNFITVTMVTMLMGLGIDFGIHFLFRFEEETVGGLSDAEALSLTARTTGVDTLVGAVATAAAFAALCAVDFRGVADLGVLASGGVLLCYLSTVSTVSALLGTKGAGPGAGRSGWTGLLRAEEWLLSHYRKVVYFGAVFFFAGLLLCTQVGFSHNLLDVQSQQLDSVRTEQELQREYGITVLSGAVLVPGREQARETAARLRDLKTVSQVGTITDLLPVVTSEKQALVERIVFAAGQLESPEPLSLDRARDLRYLKIRFQEMEETPGGRPLEPEVTKALEEVKAVLSKMNFGPIQDGLKSFQRTLFHDFDRLLHLLRAQVATPLTPDDLPEALTARYVSPDGTYLLSVRPAEDIWQRDNLERFLREVESAGVALVGHPVVQLHILEAFDDTFRKTPFYTLMGVFAVMLLYLRRPGRVLLSSLPTLLGVVLILAVMGATGQSFNVVNFVALPISVGIGAIYGVHALHRIRERGDERLMNTSTGHGILLSGLTTIAGFASLMTAEHQGLSSFGFVISTGVVANLLVSLVVLPALCRFLKPGLRS